MERPALIQGLVGTETGAVGGGKAGAWEGLAMLAVSLALAATWAVELSLLWGWFIVPPFGLPSLSPLAVLGVQVFIRSAVAGSGGDGRALTWRDYRGRAIYCIVVLAFGYALHLLIVAFG